MGEVERALHDAEEFVGNFICYATGPVKEELWEDDSLLVEQAWALIKTLRAAQETVGPTRLTLSEFNQRTGPKWRPSNVERSLSMGEKDG